MFSPYLLLKLVRRSHAMRSKSVKDKPIISEELDRYSRHMSNKCRVCLQLGEIPIFGSLEHPDISVPMRNFADIDINKDDKLPKLLCDACHKLLQAAIVFRSTAQQTDLALKHTIKMKTYDDAISDDRVNETDSNVKPNEENKSKMFYQHKKDKKYFCKVCYIDFETINEYYDHVITLEHKKQKKNPDIQCNICNKTLRRHYYTQHLQLHASERHNKIKCKICKQTYKRGEYKYHMKNHENIETNYVCDICGKSFAKRSIYRCHLQTHSSVFPFECEYCPYKGRNMSLLKTHVRTHTRDYRYNCTECSARFLTSSNLNRHMAKHKGRKFECDTCKRRFYSKYELQQHFKVDHLGIKDYLCSICDKAFGYRNALKKHQLHVHKREKFINGKGRMPAYLAAKQNQIELLIQSSN